jgi:signal transduction histidine kinase/CheY-like chemotaxis protein
VLERINLPSRLLILVAVATIPALLVMVYLQLNLLEDGRKRISAEALRQADSLSVDMSNVVEGARQISVAITRFTAVRAGDPACRRDLMDLLADLPSYAMLSVVAEDGQVICSSEADALRADSAVLADLRRVLDKRAFGMGLYMPATTSHGPIMPGYLPFITTSGRRAVVLAGLNLGLLATHLRTLKGPVDGTITLADRNGVILARVPDLDDALGTRLPVDAKAVADAPHSGHAILADDDGKDRLVAYVPATESSLGLYVGVGMYLPGMLADLDRATAAGGGLIALSALASMLLALLVGQRFVRRPTAALLLAARRWSSGDLTARAVLAESPKSEFGSLAMAFNSMAEALGAQRTELQELNATLEVRVAQRTRDLTDSRNRLQLEMAERENAEATLVQAQKLQAVGQLAGGIAHDFNNLLTAIVGALDLMRGRLAPTHEGLVRLADSALHAAERGSRLTGQLLTFSRRQRLLPVPTDLNMTVMALSNLLGGTLGRSVRIQTDLLPDLWPAMIDPSEIEAAIINLAINARDAMPEGGVLTIATRNLSLSIGSTAPPGDYVAVSVADTGCGMPPEVLARVFEPFFTTKEPGRGSGLGLSQVHGLAVQSGGDVRVESKPGEGTTVTLLVPRGIAMPVARPAPVGGSQRPRRRARVLVVDDDHDVRAMIGEMLAERGYAVVLIADPSEALATMQQDSGFDVMLVDYVMPGMNGGELIRKVWAFRPSQRVLLMTGNATVRLDESIGPENIIRKPFTVAGLDERLDRLLVRPVLGVVQMGLTGSG